MLQIASYDYYPLINNKEDLLQCYEFGNDPMNICFKHKTRMKVDYGIKDIRIL